MCKYKMVCLDIDGTLINSNHKITEKTKEVINKIANEMKIYTVLVSARMPKGIIPLQNELNISEPIICYSGALIMDKHSNVLVNKVINSKVMKKIYDTSKDFKVSLSIYKDDEWYIENLDKWAINESEITNISPKIIDFNNLIKQLEKQNSGANKILCMGEPEDIQLLYKKITTSNEDINVYPSKPTYLEIMAKEVSKTSAIEFLCKEFNVERSQVIAIGDNYNDIDMIEYAALGIAMGNAPSKVKEHADEVTFTNDEDGVAKALEKHLIKVL
ncbi:Cof-type HAD-IIB family hydrolase [Clostridium sp. 'White wine YQ']|uniref:Cof-type HAD-IIB family hydrolase n=1 Tax=Clostridium sp. 'White wine YQ' TaxID=3027474 RepID=UPI002366C39C|nr:Cof-type HAD-IIB family hydrolase [Clostridium sp. 'White wine YQ']MDD7794482.1 Cof-type HAD-IIB family hydrolase [Clostridium sp. 'White wine YQ']